MKLKLTYIYHSGFAIQAPGVTILIDYWQDSAKGRGGERVTLEIAPRESVRVIGSSEEGAGEGWVKRWLEEAPAGEAFYVLSSHFHADHFNPEVLSWCAKRPEIHYILSADIAKHRRAPRSAATFIHKGESYSDGRLTVKAFGSTDVGVSFLLTLDGVTIFHAGDLNNWHWKDESTPEEVRKAEGDFLAELRDIRREVEAVDVAFFPVDNRMGSDYMRGARQFVEAIRVGLFVPMHYDEERAAAAAFQAIAQANGAGVWTPPAPLKGG